MILTAVLLVFFALAHATRYYRADTRRLKFIAHLYSTGTQRLRQRLRKKKEPVLALFCCVVG
jgi:hypothetical protein